MTRGKVRPVSVSLRFPGQGRAVPYPGEVLKKLIIMVRNDAMRRDKTACGIIDTRKACKMPVRRGKKGMTRAKRSQELNGILLQT
jgi:hypothetical protein